MEQVNIHTSFSNAAIYRVILLAAVLFILFRIIRWLLSVTVFKKNNKEFIRRYSSAVELIAWTGFLFWAVSFVWDDNRYYAIGLLVLLFGLSFWILWLSVRDFLAGAVFKITHNLHISDGVKIGDYSGKIVNLTPTHLIMETETSEMIHLPYSKLTGLPVIKSHPAEAIFNHTFRIVVPGEKDIQETMDQIYKELINLPWSSLKKEPQIKSPGATENGYIIEITAFSINKEYFPEIEKAIKRKYDITENEKTAITR